MVEWKHRIVADPDVLVGKPVIKGTRLSVDFVLSLLANGWTEQQVFENYPQLEPADLQALFGFAQACLREEEFVGLERDA